MATPRKPTIPTTDAVDEFCAQFDDLFPRRAARQAFRHYLIGLLLPREHNKTHTVLASLVPGGNRQQLHHFMHDAPWDAQALNARRLQLWQEHPTLRPHKRGVLIVDETGDRKRGQGIPFAAQQDIGKLGHTANGVVSVTTTWSDGTHHVPLGVKPYWPASRLPDGKQNPRFRTKPELAGELIAEAEAAGIPFGVVVADCISGENATLEAKLHTTGIPYVLAIHATRGVWQVVADEANPPAFNPHEAAQRVPLARWQRVVRHDSHGKKLVHYVVELELGTAYGPRRSVRLIAATTDPVKLKKDATWYLISNLPLEAASAEEIYRTYCLRDWVEHYYKPAKHELGWADFQMRHAEAIVRHWQLVMLAYTFCLLHDAPLPGWRGGTGTEEAVGGNITGSRGVESDAGAHSALVGSLGAHQPLLAALDHRPASPRAGRPARPPRPVPAA